LESLKAWWDKLLIIGPPIGYFPNATKTWLVVKQEHLDKARELFDGTGIQITQEGTGDKSGGQRYLGAAIGTQSFIKQYVQDKVAKWVTELEELYARSHKPNPSWRTQRISLDSARGGHT